MNNDSDMPKTKINTALKAGANYAGAYIIVKITYDSSCLNANVVNLNDGLIIKLPLGG